MKRTAVLALLGVGVAATAYGQGGIIFNNSLPVGGGIGSPNGSGYNPIVWDASVGAATTGVVSTDGVSVSVWAATGANPLADTGFDTVWNAAFEGASYFGYYQDSLTELAGWVDGQTWNFQLRASGSSIYGNVDEASSISAIWQESANIGDVSGALPPGISDSRIGFTVFVPEPTTFALAGLGAAALLIFRRRD